jgi:hypothetical protein
MFGLQTTWIGRRQPCSFLSSSGWADSLPRFFRQSSLRPGRHPYRGPRRPTYSVPRYRKISGDRPNRESAIVIGLGRLIGDLDHRASGLGHGRAGSRFVEA